MADRREDMADGQVGMQVGQFSQELGVNLIKQFLKQRVAKKFARFYTGEKILFVISNCAAYSITYRLIDYVSI